MPVSHGWGELWDRDAEVGAIEEEASAQRAASRSRPAPPGCAPTRAVVEEERPLALALGTHRAIGVNLHTAGLLENREARIRTLEHATEELARSQSRLEYADALCDYGAALRRANRRSQARAPLREAVAIARAARAKRLQDRAVQELKATGERVSRPDAAGVDALTASERRIATWPPPGQATATSPRRCS